MKDCSTCEHRAELHPEYTDMEWGDLPCATCRYDTDAAIASERPKVRQVGNMREAAAIYRTTRGGAITNVPAGGAVTRREPWEDIEDEARAIEALESERDAERAKMCSDIMDVAATIDGRLPRALELIQDGATQEEAANCCGMLQPNLSTSFEKLRQLLRAQRITQ